MGVLVLLGNENNDEGHLTPVAEARCQRAIEILNVDGNLKVLPTGAFGRFNSTVTAHGEYLTRYLLNHGIARERILPHTNSSNTVEDILCARRAIVDLGEDHVIVLTSAFHMPRVKFIVERVFTGLRTEFQSAPDNLPALIAVAKMAEEARKLDHTQSEWVDIPLYSGASAGFPARIYENAHSEHKHYDNVSLAIITGMIAVFIYPYMPTSR